MFGKQQRQQKILIETPIQQGAREFREQMEQAGHSPAYVIEQLEWVAALWGDDLPVAALAYETEAQHLRRELLTR